MSNEAGTYYAYSILQKWNEIFTLSEQVRTGEMENRDDYEVLHNYVSKLSRLWVELYPKVHGRNDLKDLLEEFNTYEKFAYDPSILVDEIPKLLRLEHIIRMILEELEITKFEGEVTS